MADFLGPLERAASENPEFEQNASDWLKRMAAKVRGLPSNASESALSNVNEANVPRHAEDSARVFQEQLPNDARVDAGKALVPSKPNFELRPPSEIPPLANPPVASRNTGFTMSEPAGLKNPPAFLEPPVRDVTNSIPESLRPNSPIEDLEMKNHGTDYGGFEEAAKPGMSAGKKAAIGAGLGLAGLGAYNMMGGDKPPGPPQSSLFPEAQAEEAPSAPQVEVKPAAAPKRAGAGLAANKIAAATGKPAEEKKPDQPKEEQPEEDDSEEAPEENKFLDFGTQAQNKNDIKEVQNRQNMAELVNGLGKAAERIGAGINRTQPVAQQAYDQQIKDAGQITQQYLDRKAQEDSDPASGSSRAARDYIKQFGINVSDGASASQLKQIMPMVFKNFEAKQAAQAKADDLDAKLEQRGYDAQQKREAEANLLKQKLDERKYEADQKSKDRALAYSQLKAQKDALASHKQEESDNKDINKLNEKMTGDIASSRSAFGRAANNYQAIQNAKALLNGEKDPNDLDNRQVFELTRVADRVLSNGNPTQFGAEHLNPDTARARLAKIQEFIQNQRQGAQAGSFVNQISKTMDREEQQAKEQMQRTHKELLGPYRDLYNRNPERFGDMLEAKRLPRDIFSDQKGQVFRQPAKQASGPIFDPSAAMAELQRRKQQQGGGQ